jgi:hypothetical protein
MSGHWLPAVDIRPLCLRSGEVTTECHRPVLELEAYQVLNQVTLLISGEP